MEARQDFTTFSDAPNTSSFNDAMASLMGSSTGTVAASATSTVQITRTTGSNSLQSPQSTFTTVPSSASSGLLSTVPATSASSNTASTSRRIASTTVPSATNAPLNAGGGLSRSDSCDSISCSPRLQAAVAVPVVIGVVIVVALVVFLARRKRRTSDFSDVDQEKPKQGWSRHLRIFSFDNELIHGGRYSGSENSRNHGSGQCLTQRTHQLHDPSLHSINSVAPPYRDTVEPVQHSSMMETRPGLAAGRLAATAIPRPTSRASAPPPYGPTENQRVANSTISTTAATAATDNPFSDPNAESPVLGSSPFADPSEDGHSARSRPTASRNSSLRTDQNPDEHSTWYDSDAGSVREAQVGRHVSVTSGGRQINVRHSNASHSPANSD